MWATIFEIAMSWTYWVNMQNEVKSARSSIVVPHFYSTSIMSGKEFFSKYFYASWKFRIVLCLKALPMSWSISINLSRKSLTEATLRRMMGWRGSIHCSFPWPSWRPRFPTLCSAWHPPRHNFQFTPPTQLVKVWMSAPVGVSLLLGPFPQPTPDLTPAGRPSLSACEAQLWWEVWPGWM